MLGELVSVGLGVVTLIGVVEEALDGAPEGTAYRVDSHPETLWEERRKLAFLS